MPTLITYTNEDLTVLNLDFIGEYRLRGRRSHHLAVVQPKDAPVGGACHGPH